MNSWTDYLTPFGTQEQWGQHLRRMGPPALALGVGAAGIQNLAAALHQIKHENDQVKKENSDVLTVEIPGKQASDIGQIWDDTKKTLIDPILSKGKDLVNYVDKSNPVITHPHEIAPDYTIDAGMATATGLGALGLGYYTTNAILENRRKQQMSNRLDAAKNEYSHLLGQTLSTSKVAELELQNYFPVLSGLCDSISDEFYKQALPDAAGAPAGGATPISFTTSAASSLAVLAAVLSHNLVYDHMNKVDDMRSYSKPGPPKAIKLVAAPSPVAQENEEKTANHDKNVRMVRDGIIGTAAGTVGGAALGGTVGGALALIADATYPSKNHMEDFVSRGMLFGGVRGAIMGGVAGVGHGSAKQAIDLPEIAGGVMLASKMDNAEDAKTNKENENAPAEAETQIIDPRTSQIIMPQGNTAVEAGKGISPAVLAEKTNRLATILKTLQAKA